MDTNTRLTEINEGYGMKSRIAAALANSVADGLMFSGAITDKNVATLLFDRLADKLVTLPDDELLLLFQGVYHNVQRQRSDLATELAGGTDEWGTTDTE